MGDVKIAYYVVRHGRGYWQPKRSMKEQGFAVVACGPDGPDAWRIAQMWNDRWKAHVAGRRVNAPPPGSLAEAFERFRKLAEWEKKAVRTREDWERGWKHIKPFFGDVPPHAIDLEMISSFRQKVAREVSEREAHRVIKIWRAMWTIAEAFGYCDGKPDPSLGVRNTEPKKRTHLWTEREVRRLVKRAWKMGYYGLAAVIAVAWDTMLSPVDVRTLTPAQRAEDGRSFAVSRAKTGRAASGTLSRASQRVLDAYLRRLGAKVAPNAPMMRNRSGAPYSKDTLGDDFRDIRAAEFGPTEKRALLDFRRSGAVEAIRGGAQAAELAAKMANDLSSSNNLHKTYVPVDTATVLRVDEARKRARKGTKRA